MKILLVSTNAGTEMGGEAVKAIQYFDYLLENGFDVTLVTHERCRPYIEGKYDPTTYELVKNSLAQVLLWRSIFLRPLLIFPFNRAVVRIASRYNQENICLHFIGPVSPIVVRDWPRGYRCVIGPLTGNIYYPPAFRKRQGTKQAIVSRIHRPVQITFRFLFGDKKKADRILVSGYERTRASLRWAGAKDRQMVNVVDAGVHRDYFSKRRLTHEGTNFRFICTGRMDDHKGIDLAIKALKKADPRCMLTIVGDGKKRQELEALAYDLGVSDRAIFKGWLPYEMVRPTLEAHRAYIFPTLAEANGIVMQEAMTIGLPVITLNWGGPSQLSDPETSILIDPKSEDYVVSEIARAMTILGEDAELADRMSKRGRKIAEEQFTWQNVGASYTAHYSSAAPAETAMPETLQTVSGR